MVVYFLYTTSFVTLEEMKNKPLQRYSYSILLLDGWWGISGVYFQIVRNMVDHTKLLILAAADDGGDHNTKMMMGVVLLQNIYSLMWESFIC